MAVEKNTREFMKPVMQKLNMLCLFFVIYLWNMCCQFHTWTVKEQQWGVLNFTLMVAKRPLTSQFSFQLEAFSNFLPPSTFFSNERPSIQYSL